MLSLVVFIGRDSSYYVIAEASGRSSCFCRRMYPVWRKLGCGLTTRSNLSEQAAGVEIVFLLVHITADFSQLHSYISYITLSCQLSYPTRDLYLLRRIESHVCLSRRLNISWCQLICAFFFCFFSFWRACVKTTNDRSLYRFISSSLIALLIFLYYCEPAWTISLKKRPHNFKSMGPKVAVVDVIAPLNRCAKKHSRDLASLNVCRRTGSLLQLASS